MAELNAIQKVAGLRIQHDSYAIGLFDNLGEVRVPDRFARAKRPEITLLVDFKVPGTITPQINRFDYSIGLGVNYRKCRVVTPP